MKKIVFRQLKQSELDAVYCWVKEMEKEDTYILINPREPTSLKDEKEYFKDFSKKIRQKRLVKIGVFSDKKYLGSCDIEKSGKRQGHIGVFGIALLKECRGRGIGFKLAQETIRQARQKLGIKKVILNCFANNKAGINLYKKLGFTQYGLLPRAVLCHGKLVDEIMFYKDL